MTTSWLFLRPRDTLAVRDGRPFDAGIGATARTVFPWPSTVAGAVGSIYRREVGSIRGPFLSYCHERDHGPEFELLFPAPADLYAWPGATWVHRLAIAGLDTGVTTDLIDEGIRYFPRSSDGEESVLNWMRAAALETYLAHGDHHQPFDLRSDFARGRGPQDTNHIVSDEPHTGLKLTAQRTPEPGQLYIAHHMRFADKLGLLVCVEDEAQLTTALPTCVTVGGESRLADVEHAERVALPAAPDSFPGGRVLLYLATPGIWAGGWRPNLPEGAVLKTAALKEPIPVPTASPKSRDQPGGFFGTTRLNWAVPAGSVYYVKFPDPDTARTWVHGTPQVPGVHGRPLTAANPRLGTAGFGVVLAGTWAEPEETGD